MAKKKDEYAETGEPNPFSEEPESELKPDAPPDVAPPGPPIDAPPDVPGSCINCGQDGVPIQVTSGGFQCPLCGHAWTPAEERAPFRQG